MPFRFEGLEIWALARQFVTHIYEVTTRFPTHERYALADQWNRVANSVALNIAEGAGQDTEAQFSRYLGISNGSLSEVIGGLFLALDRGYIDQPTLMRLYEEGDHLIRAITNFHKTLRAR
ncbi:MAG: four helix bundle protein [Anaerolineae bacterium]|jgi:four helix bundle protein